MGLSGHFRGGGELRYVWVGRAGHFLWVGGGG